MCTLNTIFVDLLLVHMRPCTKHTNIIHVVLVKIGFFILSTAEETAVFRQVSVSVSQILSYITSVCMKIKSELSDERPDLLTSYVTDVVTLFSRYK